jgi:hypothetical protein
MKREVKLRMYNIIANPVLQYGSEPCVLREEDNTRIEAS